MNKIFIPLIGAAVIGGAFSIYAFANTGNAKDLSTAEFRYNINRLTETAKIIELSKGLKEYGNSAPYGSDANEISLEEINAGLKEALVNIGDKDKNEKLSESEIKALDLRQLNPDIYKKEMDNWEGRNTLMDMNLHNYLVITKGEHAGTILYNGKLKFADSKNDQYFGIDIFK